MFFDLWKHSLLLFSEQYLLDCPYPLPILSSLQRHLFFDATFSLPLSQTLVFLNILSLAFLAVSVIPAYTYCLPNLHASPNVSSSHLPLFYWWHHHLPSFPDLNSQELQILLMSLSIWSLGLIDFTSYIALESIHLATFILLWVFMIPYFFWFSFQLNTTAFCFSFSFIGSFFFV